MKPKQQSTTDFLKISFTPPKRDIVEMMTRMSNIRCRTCTYDVNRTYDILRTMSQVHNLNIIRAMSYVRCDIQCRTSDLRCRVGRRTTSYVTYDIVGGKNPDVIHIIMIFLLSYYYLTIILLLSHHYSTYYLNLLYAIICLKTIIRYYLTYYALLS